MRHHTLHLVTFALAVTIAACSGSDTLGPAPSTSLNGGSSHGSDTAVNTGPQNPPSPPPPVVASFSLSGIISGHEPGADTMHTAPVAGATITLIKIATVDGDTLNPSVSTAMTITDAQGAYRIENLAPAYYNIYITAPAGSPYENGTSGIGPAREVEVKVFVSLARKP
jgi:hypothetical protein